MFWHVVATSAYLLLLIRGVLQTQINQHLKQRVRTDSALLFAGAAGGGGDGDLDWGEI